MDWPRVPYGQGHHFDRTDRANTSPGRREDAGGPGSGNWIRFDPVAFKSLQSELMKGGTEPVMTAPVKGPVTGAGGDPDESQGATVSAGLTHPMPAAPREAVTERRRIFAELGVSEDELLKLVSNAEFVAGVKRLRTAAQAVTSDSLTDTPMVVGGAGDGVGRRRPSPF